eukprot:4940151-Pleurochrysis_carterae.AAC.1
MTSAPLAPSSSSPRAFYYPTYACDEHGGWGWSAKVLARRWSSAKVSFDRARADDGRPYAP